jgi:hypothetical protein
MKIGLIAVDSRHPNLALMKIAAWHRSRGDEVEWADPMFGRYDRVYASKIFSFSPDFVEYYDCETVKGGTGYDILSKLPKEIDDMTPDYTIHPDVDAKTAYGFLTRGCPNKCKWCVVPQKEGPVAPYRDVDDVAENGRRPNLVLMDNNILASDYGLMQIEKIVERRYRVDFNQALDARLVTDDVARLLAKARWLDFIRFGCDTPMQVDHCNRAMRLIDSHRERPASYLLYTMLTDNLQEAYDRTRHFRDNPRVRLVAQPYRNFDDPTQAIPQWQKDMARWTMRRELYASTDFKDYQPRKGFKCRQYFNTNDNEF